VLQATIDHVRDSVQAQFSDAESQWRAVGAEVLKGLDAWGTPARAPAYGSFRLDDDGNLWVAAYALENSIEPITWHVFDVNGRLLGDVVFPPAVVPSHITSDQIIGIWTDPDGLERVVAYPLLRDSTGM
jgi:malate synthase